VIKERDRGCGNRRSGPAAGRPPKCSTGGPVKGNMPGSLSARVPAAVLLRLIASASRRRLSVAPGIIYACTVRLQPATCDSTNQPCSDAGKPWQVGAVEDRAATVIPFCMGTHSEIIGCPKWRSRPPSSQTPCGNGCYKGNFEGNKTPCSVCFRRAYTRKQNMSPSHARAWRD
jgi:hypothetical protein